MTSEPTFADLGEDRIVARILARIPAASHVLIGPGDDAAVSESPGLLVSTADMLVEGEDFLQYWLDPFLLGVKAAAQNLADVRAMGARPTGLLLSLAAPGHTPASFVDGLMEGMVEEAGRAGASVLGGDLSDAPQIVISVTALGSLPADQTPFTRNAACAGFDVFLGGQTGWAAAGLDLLLAADGAVPHDLSGSLAKAVEAQRAPRPDYACVDRLREAVDQPADRDPERMTNDPERMPRDPERMTNDPELTTHHLRAASDQTVRGDAALIDLSDGLSSDAGRMAKASGTVIDLDPEALDALAHDLVPVAAHVLALTDEAASDGRARSLARRWVLTGGEDHGFLAAVPQGVDPIGWTRIGQVVPLSTVTAGDTRGAHVLIDGVSVEESGFAAGDPDGGFRHFSGAGE